MKIGIKIRYVPRTSGSFNLSRNIRIQCNSFLDIAYNEVYELFCYVYLGPNARLGCFFRSPFRYIFNNFKMVT